MTSAASPTTPAWVILDYGSIQPLVRFRANPSSQDLVGSYPQDFEIQTSIDKVNWTAMVHVEGMIGDLREVERMDCAGHLRALRAPLHHRRGPASGAASYVAMGEFEPTRSRPRSTPT